MNSIYSRQDLLDENKDITNFYSIKDSLSDEDINKLLKISEKYTSKEATISNGIKDNNIRTSTIKWIPNNNETKWLYDNILKQVKEANKIWGFDITGFGEPIQYGIYSSENTGHYDWHLDIGKKTNYRKISISIQLSNPDEYEGGELQFYTTTKIKTAPKTKGTSILFPSYFLHRVTPVTKGIRKSLVIWISGKPFK